MAKEPLPPYTVLVHELPLHRAFEVPSNLVGDWLKGLPMRDALGAPDPDPEAGQGHAELDLYQDGTHAFASGTFKGHLMVACSRCVGPVRLDIDEKLMVTFLPPAEMPADDAGYLSYLVKDWLFHAWKCIDHNKGSWHTGW
jgi:hypothetical protein